MIERAPNARNRALQHAQLAHRRTRQNYSALALFQKKKKEYKNDPRDLGRHIPNDDIFQQLCHLKETKLGKHPNNVD